jgi:nicotinamidase-related amidase
MFIAGICHSMPGRKFLWLADAHYHSFENLIAMLSQNLKCFAFVGASAVALVTARIKTQSSRKSGTCGHTRVTFRVPTALVVVDLQEEFVLGISSMLSDFPHLPQRVAGLLQWARGELPHSLTNPQIPTFEDGRHPLQILHIRELDCRHKSTWAKWWMKLNVGKTALATNTKAVNFAQEAANEPVLLKHTYDAFSPGCGIHEQLQIWGVKRLIICGCLTKACVMFTANSAFIQGYEVYVLEDCCADRSRDHHNSVLRVYNGYHIKVISSHELMNCQDGTGGDGGSDVFL